MNKVAVISCDHNLQSRFERFLLDAGHRVAVMDSGEELLASLQHGPPDLVIIESELPRLSGLETLEQLRKISPWMPVVIFSHTSTPEDAIKASKLGAFEYVIDPSFDDEMVRLVNMAIETGHFMRVPVGMAQHPEKYSDDNLVGQSQPMQAVYKAIGKVAPTDTTVLIRGESGTGKELVARAIYQHSHRAKGPFVVVNCVAIPESLLESVLFGYEKGAFTGADKQRIGKIEYAEHGTVFLDEIGDIPLKIQAKLLRLLQEKSIERLGGKEPIQTDVRIIAATNADLESKMHSGRFREDLYYRINVVSLQLPPLRDRSYDISLLADYFLSKFSYSLGVRNPGMLPEAKAVLKRHRWPGNVREMANTIEKCLIFSKGHPIGQEDIDHLVADRTPSAGPVPDDVDAHIETWVKNELRIGNGNLLSTTIDRVAKIIIYETLLFFNGNRSRAAKELGISRPTLRKKMAGFGLDESFPDDPEK